MPPAYIDRSKVATVKMICSDPVLTSKFLALLDSIFKENRDTEIKYNPADSEYYVFTNINNDVIREALQEISPYPEAVRKGKL